MKQFFTSLLIVTVLMSCGTASKKDKPAPSGNTNSVVLPQPYSPVAGTLPSPNQISTAPINNTTASTTTTPTGGVNPAHGQPGHRCELAVGAPLNSPATTSPNLPFTPKGPAGTTTTISEPIITTTGANPPKLNFNPTTTAPTVTAPGMNPAHGQPGHKCEIGVGEPLNSKPSVALPTTTTTTIPTVKTEQVPAAKVVTAPGMNPPHGEPGHQCGITVGAPLNGSKTTDAKVPPTSSVVAAVDSSKKQ